MMYEQTSPTHQTARLEDYLKAIRNHWLLILLAIAAALALALWWSGGRTPNYSAETAVALGPTPVGSVNANLEAPSVERESEILASRKTAEAVILELDLSETPASLLQRVDVQFVPNSDVLQVSVSGSDPEETAAIANAMVEVYAAQREADATAFYDDDVSVRADQLQLASDEVTEITERLDTLIAERQTTADLPATDERSTTLASIDGQLVTLRSELNNALAVERELKRALSDGEREARTRQLTAEVIRLSDTPEDPTGIPNSLIIFGAGFIGLIAGVAVSFIMDRLDRTARDEQALSLALGASVVGEIPSFGLLQRSGNSGLIMLDESTSARVYRTQESIRRLRSAVQFLIPTAGRGGTLAVAISSAYPGEGKSTTSANLAVALAQAGQNVMLVSGDLRRPMIEQLFGVESETGLADLLGGLEESMSLVASGVGNLWLVPAGSPAKNPSELLGSGLFKDAIAELREQSDVIIIDTPPILSAADALVVGRQVDGMLIVVDSRTTDTDDLLKVRAELERSGTELLGGVLNRDRRKRGSVLRRDRYAYARVAKA